MDALTMPWANARVVHLLSVHRMMTMRVGKGPKEEPNPDGYDQVMFTLLLPCGASEGGKGLYGRMHQCHGTSPGD